MCQRPCCPGSHATCWPISVDGDTAIAEWLAEFEDLEKGVRKRMREIAVMTSRGHLISSLREVWASEVIGTL